MKIKMVFACMALLLFSGPCLMAQEGPEGEVTQAVAPVKQKTIAVIMVKGNKAISSATILSKIKSKPGDVFSQDQLNGDLKRLFSLGFFTDISIETEDTEGGVTVTFVVVERPLISQIVFTGNKALRADKLIKEIKSAENEMLDETKLKGDIEQIKTVYKKRGFQQVEARYELSLDKEKNTAKVTIIIDEKTRLKIKRIDFIGNKNILTKELRKSISTRPDGLFTSGYLKEDTLETDLEKLKYLYEARGFLDAKITHQIQYDPTGHWIVLRIEIDEGKKYVVGDITITGNKTFPEWEIRSRLTMVRSRPFSQTALRQDISNIQQFYYQKGYMLADVNGAPALDPQTGKINITYTIVENELIYIDKIRIKGNVKTKDVVIRRELRAYPGEKFDGDKLKRSKERLYNLGFFEEVIFNTEPGTAPNKQDLVVTVKETKTGEFSFGGGFSSVEQLVGFVSVTQKNFDLFNFPTFTGDGQQLRLVGEFGTIRKNYELSWTEPWILDMPLLFGIDAYNRTRLRRTGLGYGFDEVRQGGDLRFGKEITEYLTGTAMYILEDVDISDVSPDASSDLIAEEGKNRISKAVFGLTQDRRDNIYNPGRGYLVSGSAEYASSFLSGDKEFTKYTSTAELYFTHFEKLVLELHGRAGIADAFGNSTKVPIYERFYAGGSGTIRGYRERRIGPKDPNSNDPIGGEAMLIGNVEYTFPIYEQILKGAVFYDIGNVWAKWDDFGNGSFKSGVGVGVRVKTPIGPLRLDFGYPLSKVEGEKKTGRFHFTVSQGF
ncbi:MAG: outer membrane protein assembly factor BamA [Candidatus Omnitrophica bacterium]|nr:outer membrane protein assembly factor BamA [Candidatus Omnitrophota bacterium]